MRTPKPLTDKDGNIYYRVRYRRAGKQRSLTLTGPTAEKDAKEFTKLLDTLGADRAVAFWNSHLEGTPGDEVTLDDYFARYLRTLTGITEGTRVTYERTYKRAWAKPLGSLPLSAITRADVAEAVASIAATKSDKTVRNYYGVLASAFKAAVADELIATSPCRNIKLPRRTEHLDTEMRFLTHDDWDRLTQHLPAEHLPLFTMLVGTGMRWGEAEALTVGDIILDPSAPAPAVVRINKAAKWNPSMANRPVGPTKTKRSNRTVALPPEVLAAIAPLLESGRDRSEQLFTATKGARLRHSNIYPMWLRACEAAGLGAWERKPDGKKKWRGPRIHDLRHTHVAWLIAAGIPLPVIQARLGHENITTTIDRYGHLLPDLQVAAANAASLAMQGAARPRAITAG